MISLLLCNPTLRWYTYLKHFLCEVTLNVSHNPPGILIPTFIFLHRLQRFLQWYNLVCRVEANRIIFGVYQQSCWKETISLPRNRTIQGTKGRKYYESFSQRTFERYIKPEMRFTASVNCTLKLDYNFSVYKNERKKKAYVFRSFRRIRSKGKEVFWVIVKEKQ